MAMNNMGAGFVLRGRDLASKVINRFKAILPGLKSALGNVGIAMAAVGGAGFKMGQGITSGMMKMADVAGDFEQGLASVGATTKATTSEMNLLRDSAMKAGIETQFSPTQAIEGLQTLAAAGQMATDATKTLIPVLDLAAGSLGQLGVGESAKAVVGTLNSYGMAAEEASGVTDKLLRITQLTNFQARDFANGLNKAAAVGGMYNQSLDDVLITMGLLRNRNIDASSSATDFREALRRVASDAGAQNAVMKAGVKIYDQSTGKMRSIVDVMSDFAKETSNMGEEERNRLINQTFGARGMIAFAAVQKAAFTEMKDGVKTTYKGAEAIDKLRDKMANAEGTARDFKDALLDTYAGQKTLLGGTLETIQVAFGLPLAKLLKPVVKFITNALNSLLKAFNSLPMPVKKMLTGIAGMGGIILTAAGGFMVMIGVMNLFGITITGLISSLVAFVGIMVPLALLVAGLGVGFAAASKAMRKDTRKNQSTWEMMMEKIKWSYHGVIQILNKGELTKAFTKQLEDSDQQGVLKFLRSFQRFVERAKLFWDGLVMGFEIGVAQLTPNIQKLKNEFSGIFAMFSDDKPGDAMTNWVDNGIDAGESLASLGGTVIDMFTEVVKIGKKVAASMGDITSDDIANGIIEMTANFKTMLKVFGGIGTVFSVIWRALKGIYNYVVLVGTALGEGLASKFLSMFGQDHGNFAGSKNQFNNMVNAFAGEEVLSNDQAPPMQKKSGGETRKLGENRQKQLKQLADDLRFEADTLEASADKERNKKRREKINEELSGTMAKLNTVLDRLSKGGVKAVVSYEAVADAANAHKENAAGRDLSPEIAFGV